MAQKQKKNQKFGRTGRRPSTASYKGSKRWEINKARRVKRDAAFKKDKRDNPPKVPRGTARAKRRRGLQFVSLH